MFGSTSRKAVSATVALSLLFSLAACDSAADLERKPELINQMVNQTTQTCVIKEDAKDQQPYLSRLRGMLNKSSASTLDYLIANKITICLDKRLDQQENGMLQREALGVYYPNQKVISLWDNGNNVHEFRVFSSSAASYGPRLLYEFKHNFGGTFDKHNSVEDVKVPLVSSTESCGKGCTSYGWRTHDSFWASGAMARNPFLFEPPVRVPSAGLN